MCKGGLLERVVGSGEFKRLCPAVKKRYNISGDDRLILRGVVENVEQSGAAKAIGWACGLPSEAAVTGSKPARCEMAVWCTESALHLQKTLYVPDAAKDARPGASSKVATKTTLRYHKGELVEMLTSCVGVRLAAEVSPTGALVLRSTGFVAMLGPFDLYLPLFLLPFCSVQYEETDATTTRDAPGTALLRVSQAASHPFLGSLLGATGTFKVHAAKLA
eukprot:TRINITY_DN27375_c0_g1_i1.p2 TRINITY_DN27375_c0_g1~~TRINITY_DN27375_c0_g1_i1.p2  ORF type:complete len:219 (+),score=71.81 TRINITY_DN27375_c0_g1_i1:73-729(+)